MTGTVVEGRGGFYTVRSDGRLYTLRAQKKLRRQGRPLTGDRVIFTPGKGEKHGWLEEILPRTSFLRRPPVANVKKIALVVAALPEPDWMLVEKLLIISHREGIEPLLIVNKQDMASDTLKRAEKLYRATPLKVLGVSALTGEGFEKLEEALSGGLCCLAGQSGVGKSSILSRLTGEDLETGPLSKKTDRGKQTTRHTTLLYYRDLELVDTAGFSLLDLPVIPPEELSGHYPDFTPYLGMCKFNPCYHDTEPDCRVIEAAELGKISKERLQNYQILLNELKEKWRKRYD